MGRQIFLFISQKEADGLPHSFSSLGIKAMYQVGLLRKKGQKFAKASLDGIAFVENDDGEEEMIPVEVKSRVSVQTMNDATDRIEDYIGAEHYVAREKYLVKATLSNPVFRMLLHDEKNPQREQKESLQLLHGAFVSGKSRGLMLVGSNKDLLYAIDVTFEAELLEAYKTIIEYIYDGYFKSFYELSVKDLVVTMGKEIDEAVDFVD